MPSISSPPSTTRPNSPLAGCHQLLIARADNWTSTTGQLQRWARDSTLSGWQVVGPAIPVTFGRAGLAWGIGLHPETGSSGTNKQEGDGRAPAGIFAIGELFGEAAPDSPFARALRLPYRHAMPDIKAIDDPASVYYNRIVDQRDIAAPDWHSHEEMRRADARYAVGAVIAHNAAPPVPGAGSCIFLHVWQATGRPTAGCTAGALSDISEICQWLDGAAAPLLVQLPQAEYQRFRKPWELP